MRLSAGTVLGPYEVGALLGTGRMGEVYRAIDGRLDRIVALKILPAQLSANPEKRQRFQREARTISSFNHPHICRVYDVCEHSGVRHTGCVVSSRGLSLLVISVNRTPRATPYITPRRQSWPNITREIGRRTYTGLQNADGKA